MNMTYLVLAYPKLKPTDYDWVQNYRKDNDTRYFSIVEPHITLVFAIDGVKQDEFVTEVKRQVHGFKPFEFEIKVATINQDESGEYFHEFLVPDKGYSDIVKLHDRLYSDEFASSLRYDIDFIPHIGIGNSNNAKHSKERIDELNSQDIFITGTVEAIDIVSFENGVIATIDKIRF